MSQVIVTPFQCKPGIQRDGTAFSSGRYLEGSWVRFVNNQPKKIGGCFSYVRFSYISDGQQSTPFLLQSTNGPSQKMFVLSAASSTITLITMDFVNLGPEPASVVTIPIEGEEFVVYKNMGYTSGVGSFCELTFASSLYPHWYYLPAFNALDITSSKEGNLYFVNLRPGDAPTTPYILYAVKDYVTGKSIANSGGVWCAQTFPLIITFGSNGSLIYNNPFHVLNIDNPDQTPLNTWTDADGNFYTRQIAQCKIVAMRSTMGQQNLECALAWGLFGLYLISFDAVVDNNGQSPAKLQITSTVVSTSCSVLGQNTIVEANNQYFWIGLGCFYTYNGTAQELTNDTNKIWFYKNINKRYANISYGVLNTQFSEIWWVFPKGDSTFCNHAIVYNYQTGVWYDTPFIRSAGCPSLLDQTILYTTPVLTPEQIKNVQLQQTYASLAGVSADSYQLFAHEVGVDAVSRVHAPDDLPYPELIETTALISYFTYNLTALFTTQNSQNRSILNVMIELDLDMPDNKNMSIRIYNLPYPADWAYGVKAEEPEQTAAYGDFYTFTNRRRYIYLQSQGRIVTVRFQSNDIGGDYWMGTCLWHWQYGSVNPSTPDTIQI